MWIVPYRKKLCGNRQMPIKGKIFNTPLSVIDQMSKPKFSKNTQVLNTWFDLMNMYRKMPTLTESTHSFRHKQSIYVNLPFADHKTSINQFHMFENVLSIFSDHSEILLKINTSRITRKSYLLRMEEMYCYSIELWD